MNENEFDKEKNPVSDNKDMSDSQTTDSSAKDSGEQATVEPSEDNGGQQKSEAGSNPNNENVSSSQGGYTNNSGLYGNEFFNPYSRGGGAYNPYDPRNFQRPQKPKKPKNPYTLLTVFVVVGLVISLVSGIVGMVIGGAIMSASYDDKLAYANSIINIETNNVEKNESEAGSASWVYEECRDSVVSITTKTSSGANLGTGSGVFVNIQHQNATEPYAYIITANHVISGAGSITVQTYDGRVYNATAIGGDSWSDIALIRIVVDQSSVYKPRTLATGTDYVKAGENIVVIGNPLGDLTWSISTGVVSGLNREVYLDGYKMNLMQIDAAVNPGNSGGAVFDMHGNLVGIVNAKTVTTGVEGIGYAIPSPDALEIITELLDNGGYVSGRPYIGIGFQAVSNVNVADAYLFTGYMITSYAFGDQLKYGDLLISVDGTALTDSSQITKILSEKSVGDSITFTVFRLNTQTNKYAFETLNVTVQIHSIDDYYALGQ